MERTRSTRQTSFDFIAQMHRFEAGQLGAADEMTLFQFLVDSDIILSLPTEYRQVALKMLQDGVILQRGQRAN